jgi:inosine/xanthosine triphosphatase
MEFVIGSSNPTKIKAASSVIASHFPQASISNADVGSGVPNQPVGDEETQLGAINRALRASGMVEGAFGIGLEGGVRMIGEQMYLCNWGALVLPDGKRFTAGGAQIPLPKEIAVKVSAGNELGPVVDNYFELSGIRIKEGAIGMLTAHTVNRDDMFTHVLQLLIGQLKYHQQSQL